MEGRSMCNDCNESFIDEDELNLHFETCAAEACAVKTDVSHNLMDGIPHLPSAIKESIETPNPIQVDTPVPSSKSTPEQSDGDAVVEGGINSTQDVINILAGLDSTIVSSAVILDTSQTYNKQTPTAEDLPSNDAIPAAEINKVIAAYCVDAPCDKVRDVLRLYSPENSYEKQKSIFNSRCKKDDLVETLQFLGESCPSWKEVKKQDCAHKLQYRIQNLLPEECGVCKETYTVGKNDPSLLACSICGQEVHHQCYKSLFVPNNDGVSFVTLLKAMPGFHHLCPSCEDYVIPDEGIIKTTQAPQCSVQLPQQQVQEKEQPFEKLEAKENAPMEPPPLSNKGNESTPNSLTRENEHLEEKEEAENNQICRHYKNNSCKFGISGKGCPYVHPKRCSKLMNHGTRAEKGCNKGKKCKDFHPKMCPLSISKSECFDLSCSLCHVKGTKRRPSQKTVKAEKGVSKETAEVVDSSLPTADSKSSTTTGFTEEQSFLGRINLLKKELQEVMDNKLESLLVQLQSKQTSQPIPQLPFMLNPTQQQFAPIPWMHPAMYQIHRNPLHPMGY